MSGYGAPVAFERPVLFEPGDPSGVEPVRMHDARARSPARGKAQGRNDPRPTRLGKRTADGSQAQKSNAHHPRLTAGADICSPSCDRSPRRKQIGADERRKRQVGPDQQKCCLAKPPHSCGGSTRPRERACEGIEPHERRRTAGKKGRTQAVPPGRDSSIAGSGTPRKELRRRMTRLGRRK